MFWIYVIFDTNISNKIKIKNKEGKESNKLVFKNKKTKIKHKKI